VPKPAVSFSKNNEVGIISIGSCDDAIREARDILEQQDQNLNYLRVKAFPFTKEVQKFLDAHKMIFVIEQNRDGQLSKLLITETEVDPKKIKSIRLYNGIPIFPKDVVDKIELEMNAGQAA
jgi:2-oxoglutarate ferredoxin oxidoreductase subunit alpha